ncbi:MAG: hypothetical protein D6742_17765, partial [Cyanobacteria bacterium J069]
GGGFRGSGFGGGGDQLRRILIWKTCVYTVAFPKGVRGDRSPLEQRLGSRFFREVFWKKRSISKDWNWFPEQ